MSWRFVLTGAFLGLSVVATRAQAQAQDERWLPFEGCWRPVESNAGDLLCVLADGGGVRLVELASGEIVKESRLAADGQSRPVSQEGCAGTESARWSDNSRRVYLNTQMQCGAGIGRNTSGLFALVSPREWVSISAISVDSEAAIRTVRYQLVESPTDIPEPIAASLRANRLARETARHNASASLELTDIVEASRQAHPRAVEALVFERKQVFDLNGSSLLTLVDAGVPSYLINALVAVSNPDRFAVKDARVAEVVDAPRASDRSGYRDRYCDDLDYWYSRYCYGRYGYSRFGYYSPYGYGYHGYRDTPVIVIVQPGSDDDTPVKPQGKATRRGYTNGTSTSSGGTRSEDRTSEPDQSTSRTAKATTSTTSTSSSGSSTSSSSSSSGSSDRGKA
ncbi:MAG: hypothetical protein ACREMA_13715, partial [Longimicrobiales bacterium]